MCQESQKIPAGCIMASRLMCHPPSSLSLSVCFILPCPHPVHPTHPQLAHQGSGAPPASTHVAATMGAAAALRMEPATAPLAGLDSSARSVSPASRPTRHSESHAAACWLPWASSRPVEGGRRRGPRVRSCPHPTQGVGNLGGFRGLNSPVSWKVRAVRCSSNHQDLSPWTVGPREGGTACGYRAGRPQPGLSGSGFLTATPTPSA